jgi:outer membrane protein
MTCFGIVVAYNMAKGEGQSAISGLKQLSKRRRRLMKKICLALFLFLAVLFVPVSSMALEVGARGHYWFPSLDGTVQVDEAGIVGDTIDFDKDLGIDDEDYPSVEAFVGLGNHHLSLTYTGIDYSGKKMLTRDIDFAGETYSVGDLVTSSIEYTMIDFHYQYDLLDLENILAGFSLGGVLQVKYLDGEVSLKTTGIDEEEDFTLPIPMLGVNLHLGILADILEARLKGTAIGYSGNTMYELMADISWTPFPFMDIHGGYKTFVIDIDEDDVVFDYDMSGPYVAVTVSF